VIDTGAHRTFVRRDIADDLGLEVVDRVRVAHASAPSMTTCDVTHAEISIQAGEGHWPLPVALIIAPGRLSPPRLQGDIGVILGMDAFEQGTLTVNGREEWWSFEVP
jgi:hypothetical protein